MKRWCIAAGTLAANLLSQTVPAGFRARDTFLAELPSLVDGAER